MAVATATKAPAPVIGKNTQAEIKRKAESGIKLDNATPEKLAIYDAYQKKINEHVTAKAKDGVSMDSGNEYKDALYKEASKKLNVNDKAYYNPNNIMLRQDMQSEGRMEALEGLLKNNADASMKSQEALLGQTRDAQINEMKKALDDAVTEGKISVREAEAQFEEQKGAIEQEAYKDAERTELTAQDRGIQNSQQMIGLMQGDNARKNSLINTNMSTRDKRVADITDRLNGIKNKSALDIANANANYGYGMAGAQGQADAQMAQQLFGMHQNDMNMSREQQFGLDSAGLANRNQLGQMALGQKYAKENMAQQQGYTQDNMQTAQNFDMAKMSKQQTYQLEQMAKSFGYDLNKMSVSQQYQLANMATSFGYDMSMQDDSQSHAEGMQNSGFAHDSNMQNDAQSHDSYQAEQSRTHDTNMFGMQEASKLAEYDTALQREMASYTAGTPEGDLRIKQLQSSKDALITETMTKTIGELMGQSFVTKYGEGMTPEQMKKWLDDPTNLNNLNTKIKVDTKVPNEKKGFLASFIKGIKTFTAPGQIYDAYSKAFKDGLPKFTP